MENTNTDKDKVSTGRPRWWASDHESAWERVKTALRRDWEQTKHDFSKKRGQDLDQDVGDTVKQAIGTDDAFDNAEPAMRFGHGASTYYRDHEWDDRTEAKLRDEWRESGAKGAWDDAKDHVRRGWDWARRKIS